MTAEPPPPSAEAVRPPCASCMKPGPSSFPHTARLVDLDFIAESTAVSIRTVRTWVSTGRLPVVRIGRTVRVRLSDWIEFLDRMRAS